MAERLIINIDGDSSGLTKALSSAETRLNSLNTRVSNTSRGLTNLQKNLSGLGASLSSMSAANMRMASNLNSLSSRLNAASAGATRHSNAINRATKSNLAFNGSLRDMTRGLSMANTLFLTGGALFGGLIRSTIEANSKIEKMDVLLKNISTAGTEAGKNLEAKASSQYLWNMADKAPFKIDALTNTFVKLKAAGIDPTQGSMQALVDTVAFFGGDSDQMKRAGVALSQMLSKGKVTAEELRQQLGDAVPNAMKDMAKALDMTIPELDKKMRDGLVLSADAVPKLMKLWQEQYGGGAENMMGTWTGLMSRMSNAWDKFIVRVTKAGGEGSFFETLKKKVAEFTTFLNTKKGDEFARQVSESFAKIIIAVGDAVAFIYKYRDAIISLAKIAVQLWVFNKVVGIFKTFTEMLGFSVTKVKSLVMIIPTAVTWLTRLAGAKNGVAVVSLLFGTNITRAANALGLFVGKGQISISVLKALAAQAGLSALRFGLIGAAVVALAFGIYKLKQAHDAARAPSETFARTLDRTERFAQRAQGAIDNLTVATGAAGVAALKTARAYEEMANKALAAGMATHAQQSYESDIANSEYDTYKAAGPTDKARFQLKGKDETTLRSAKMREEAELRASTKNLLKLVETKNMLKTGINNHLNPPKSDMGASPTPVSDAKEDKEAKAAAAKLETLKQRWVALKVKSDELNFELANGNTDKFNTDDSQDKAEEFVNKMKWSTDQAVGEINKLKDANRVAADDIQAKNIFGELTSDLGLQRDKVNDMFQTYIRGFETIEDQVDQFNRGLNDKHSKDFAAFEGNAERIAALEAAIRNATDEYRREILITAAGEIKQKNEDLMQSLMTEDQQRQSNYEREVERVQALIGAITLKGEVEGRVLQDLNTYLANLGKVKQIQSPFGQWAKDAADLKGNIENGLVGSMDSFIDGLAEGKLNFKDFAMSILKDIAKIIIRALIAQAILGALGLGGPVSMGGGGGAGSSGMSVPNSFNIPVTRSHTGSIIGKENPGMMNVHSDNFKFAKRYHKGGMPGLAHDEVPIVVQKGEGVFTKEQMKAMGGQQASPNVQVNVINQTGTEANVEKTPPRFDGEKWVTDILLKKMTEPGPVRDGMRGLSSGAR